MQVIKANSTHVNYLSDFGSKSFIHAYQSTLPLEELKEYINVAFSKETILKEINGSSATYYICQDSELNLCGYAKLNQSPTSKCIDSDNSIELQRLYVDSDYRDKGVGKLLAKHVESIAQDKNMNNIWLNVWEGNTVAQAIYKKWGFKVVGEELYKVGKEQRKVLLMCKSLNNIT